MKKAGSTTWGREYARKQVGIHLTPGSWRKPHPVKDHNIQCKDTKIFHIRRYVEEADLAKEKGPESGANPPIPRPPPGGEGGTPISTPNLARGSGGSKRGMNPFMSGMAKIAETRAKNCHPSLPIFQEKSGEIEGSTRSTGKGRKNEGGVHSAKLRNDKPRERDKQRRTIETSTPRQRKCCI
ncbi:hypothetical protein L1987_33500 [Smallanthus sonchifolius]|uniref:Uncharacterized protein n=1 Tax=Smallanthus sonchifolius TaxID=185202 RepID=A0ACB9HR86_9ASTR|nr:hypothetical protein L1987_33500 [Smallanthus sonchifolius]